MIFTGDVIKTFEEVMPGNIVYGPSSLHKLHDLKHTISVPFCNCHVSFISCALNLSFNSWPACFRSHYVAFPFSEFYSSLGRLSK